MNTGQNVIEYANVFDSVVFTRLNVCLRILRIIPVPEKRSGEIYQNRF